MIAQPHFLIRFQTGSPLKVDGMVALPVTSREATLFPSPGAAASAALRCGLGARSIRIETVGPDGKPLTL